MTIIQSIYMAAVVSAPLGAQLLVPFINLRNIYKMRERHSDMYHWTALIISQVLVEMFWNIIGSVLFLLCWYWTMGFETSRLAYVFLLYGVMFPMYYTTIAHAVGVTAPSAEIATILHFSLYSFALTLSVPLFRPFGHAN